MEAFFFMSSYTDHQNQQTTFFSLKLLQDCFQNMHLFGSKNHLKKYLYCAEVGLYWRLMAKNILLNKAIIATKMQLWALFPIWLFLHFLATGIKCHIANWFCFYTVASFDDSTVLVSVVSCHCRLDQGRLNLNGNGSSWFLALPGGRSIY